MLEPIKDKLSSKYLREKDMEHTWQEQLEALLQDTPVTLIAELGGHHPQCEGTAGSSSR